MEETKKLKSLVLSIFEMPIRNIIERGDILIELKEKNLLIKYKKSQKFHFWEITLN